MVFTDFVKYLSINENVSLGVSQKLIQTTDELIHHQDKISNLFRKLNQSVYNNAAPSHTQKLQNRLHEYNNAYKNFVNSHMDIILSDESLKQKYRDFLLKYSKALKL